MVLKRRWGALAALLVSCLPIPERGPPLPAPPPVEPSMVRAVEGTPLASRPDQVRSEKATGEPAPQHPRATPIEPLHR